jgi:hypothetical protein
MGRVTFHQRELEAAKTQRDEKEAWKVKKWWQRRKLQKDCSHMYSTVGTVYYSYAALPTGYALQDAVCIHCKKLISVDKVHLDAIELERIK